VLCCEGRIMSGRDYTWPVPYLREFQEEFQPGQSLNIRGFVIGKKRFDINLSTGPRVNGTSRDDIALHISARVEDGKFVLNSLQNNEWGKEERHSLNFKEGQEFNLRIRARHDVFELYSNGKEVANYKFRVPLQLIRCVYVDGDCELHGVNWEGKFYPIPYTTAVSMAPGKKLFVSGAATDKSKRFEINLHPANKQDFAFHYNVRCDEKHVVRNAKLGGEWGVEEREEKKFPFQKGHAFDIIIVSEANSFNVFVDGKPHCSFNHRVNPLEIKSLSIEGDLELQGLHW